MMRIIAGKHRSRQLTVPPHDDIRPTADRVREAMFSILTHRLGAWDEAVVGDICCGSGALGLEAISRGAAKAVFLDQSSAALNIARENATRLKEVENCLFMIGSVVRPPFPPMACDVLLLDPPYKKDLAAAGLAALTAAGWAAPAALAAVEVGREDSFTAPEGWQVLTTRAHGPAQLHILQRG